MMAKKKKEVPEAEVQPVTSEMIPEESDIGESWIDEPKKESDIQSHKKFSKFKSQKGSE